MTEPPAPGGLSGSGGRADVVGLDPSLTGFGWARGGAFGTWKTKLRGYDRLDLLLDFVEDLIADPPDLVVVEGYSYGSKGNSIYEIAGLGELVRFTLWAQGLPWMVYAPQVRAKYATGSGTADKKRVKREWEQATGLRFRDHNACDAHVMMTMGCRFLTGQGIYVGPPSEVERFHEHYPARQRGEHRGVHTPGEWRDQLRR